jgi:CBS domain-containing protein
MSEPIKTAKDYTSRPVSVLLHTTVLELVKLMIEENVRVVIVTDVRNELKGIVTVTDILRALTYDIKANVVLRGHVENIMTSVDDLYYVESEDNLNECIRKMTARNTHTLVVIRGRHAVGLLHQVDLIHWWRDVVISPTPPTP